MKNNQPPAGRTLQDDSNITMRFENLVPVQLSLKMYMGSLNGKNKLVYFLRRRLSICPNLKELGYPLCGILSDTYCLSPRPLRL
jgi:hypothetical protein